MSLDIAALELLNRIQADVAQLRHVLTGTVEQSLTDVVETRVLTTLPYPYRAWTLNDTVRREAPGTTTAQIHTAMRQLGYRKTRSATGITWVKG